jgi:basic amino acid/polyamine antiporter, APA family
VNNSLFRKKSITPSSELSEHTESGPSTQLSKQLNAWHLTAFGVTAIIGAGVFSTIGKASADAGPSVVFLYIFVAIACSFAAFAYAEFASMVPVSGSAYSYSYVAFGEIIAWIIGWGLIMEYAVGNTTIAVSWSDYFTSFMDSLRIDWMGITNGIHVPEWASMDYVSAKKGFKEAAEIISAQHKNINELPLYLQSAYKAWTAAPGFGNFRLIFDVPAIIITVLITWLVYTGIKETRNASMIMVIIKIIVILIVLFVGVFQIDVENYDPFMPNGVPGVLKGISGVFFAYIGFDAIANSAEECKNPERDLPRGILGSIIICTVLYILISLVITGMVHYSALRLNDPLFFVFQKTGFKWLSMLVAVSAIVAIAGVLLVFQMGQPRIWMSMSRDGLLPKRFSRIHPKFKTPSYATIVTGIVVCTSVLIIPSDTVLELSSMGTLFAFVVVCAGVLKLQDDPRVQHRKFRTPYVNAAWFLPALSILSVSLLVNYESEWLKNFFSWNGWDNFFTKIPLISFFLLCLLMNIWCLRKKLSLIPVLGLIFCFYMMAELSAFTWGGFLVWLVIGMGIYFAYSRRKSKLAGA